MALTKKQKERMIREFGHIPTKEEIFTKLEASLSRMTEALEGAWNTMPDDSKIRQNMMRAIEKSGKLRKGVYTSILKKPIYGQPVFSGKAKA